MSISQPAHAAPGRRGNRSATPRPCRLSERIELSVDGTAVRGAIARRVVGCFASESPACPTLFRSVPTILTCRHASPIAECNRRHRVQQRRLRLSQPRGACCIAASISSPIPAARRQAAACPACSSTTPSLAGCSASRAAAICVSLRPSLEMCGRSWCGVGASDAWKSQPARESCFRRSGFSREPWVRDRMPFHNQKARG